MSIRGACRSLVANLSAVAESRIRILEPCKYCKAAQAAASAVASAVAPTAAAVTVAAAVYSSSSSFNSGNSSSSMEAAKKRSKTTKKWFNTVINFLELLQVLMRHAQTGDRQLTQLSTYHFTYLRFSRASCSGAVLAGQLLVWQNAGVHISRPVLPPESPARAFTPQGQKGTLSTKNAQSNRRHRCFSIDKT